MKNLKRISLALTLTLSFAAIAQVTGPKQTTLPHGGGNGGDDLELDLKKRSLQIGYFLKSTVGSQVFKSLNPDAVLESIEKTDIDVVIGNVMDKYGTIRTCINEPQRMLITCNVNRINDLKTKKQEDVLTALLFHEILGIMGLELGHQEDVSNYPVSSKIIPYNDIVIKTPVSDANIRPEYYGIDNRSYGITLVNRKTKETIRMICLNDHVEVHQCRNYSVVRKAGEFQVPLIPTLVSLSPTTLNQVSIRGEGIAFKLAMEVLNLQNKAALIGQTKSVKEKEFDSVSNLIYAALERARIRESEIARENQLSIEAQERKKGRGLDIKTARVPYFSITFKKDYIIPSKGEEDIFKNPNTRCGFEFSFSNTNIERRIRKGTVLEMERPGITIKDEMSQDPTGKKIYRATSGWLKNSTNYLRLFCDYHGYELNTLNIEDYFSNYIFITYE